MLASRRYIAAADAERDNPERQTSRAVHRRREGETHRETTHIIFDHFDRVLDALATLSRPG